jgi:hypothetical protein
MNSEVVAAVLILLVACVLLGCGAFMRFRTEGFEDYETSIPQGMCGVDMRSCPPGLRCINGYCKTDDQPAFSPSSGLPVKPEGYIRL